MSAPVLRPLEVASGLVLGVEPAARWPRTPAPPAPLDALELAMLPALRRSPCLVSFSGGRDSSLVLAAATALARREGLPDPIPATNRFADAREADETSWQERLVVHLKLREWQRFEHTHELDALGPYAVRALRCHGLLWPFNAHFHLPLLDAVPGGSLLTGIGGDELFAAAGLPPRLGLRGRALRLSPAPVRGAVLARRHPVDLKWLRPAAATAVARALAATDARDPRRAAQRLRFWSALRYLRVGTDSLALLARDGDVLVAHPLADAGVWRSVAAAAGDHGFDNRADAVGRMFAGLLPDDVARRDDKAAFDAAFWTARSRDFAAGWSGAGVPAGLVDEAALRREWASPAPRPQSFTLLQAAWLADERLEQAVDPVLQAAPAQRSKQLPLRQ